MLYILRYRQQDHDVIKLVFDVESAEKLKAQPCLAVCAMQQEVHQAVHGLLREASGMGGYSDQSLKGHS